MQKPHLIFITLIFLFVSCSDGVKQGVVKDENGVLIKEFSYKEDSILHGPYRSFDEKGKIFEESNYVEGNLNGVRTLYFENGEKEIVENYINGVLEGVYTSYYSNGQVNLIANFEKGVMTGIVKRYYESGSLMEEVTFVENEENGPFKEYYENGQVQWEGKYLNGDNEFGLLTHYDDKGVIIKKMQCDSNAICQTIWTPEKGDIPLKIVLENN